MLQQQQQSQQLQQQQPQPRQQQRRRPRSGARTPDPRQPSYSMGADGQLNLEDGTTLLNKLAWEHVRPLSIHLCSPYIHSCRQPDTNA